MSPEIKICGPCAQAGRYGVRATLLVEEQQVCKGCARELKPGICTLGCGGQAHSGGCKPVQALR